MRTARAKRRGREKAPKRPRRPSVKDLDRACRAFVFNRDDNRCRKCGRRDGKLDWAHIYSRRYRTVRHDPMNSLVLCAGCHLWQHANPLEAMRWIEKELGEETVSALLEAKRRPKPPSPDETLAALA